MSGSDGITGTTLEVDGTLPPHLSGRYLRLGPAAGARRGSTVDAIVIEAGGAVSCQGPGLVGEAPPADVGACLPTAPGGARPAGLLEFGGRVLVLDDGEVARELGSDLRATTPVDLAGRGQGVGAHPTLDPATGELHLLASPGRASAAHQVVSHGALTRRTRPLTDQPTPIHHLTVTRDRLVLFGRGATGLATRTVTGTDRVHWSSTETVAGRDVVAAFDEGPAVVLYVTGRSLERWALEPGATVRRQAVDATPTRFGRVNEHRTASPVRYLYAVDGSSMPAERSRLCKHDLRTGQRSSRDFGPHQVPGEFLFVTDPHRGGTEDGGWLLGMVHDDRSGEARFLVLDAADPELAVCASTRLPHRAPYGHAGLWCAS